MGGLGGPGGPGDPCERWGAKPPPLRRVSGAPGAAQTPKMTDFRPSTNLKFPPSVVVKLGTPGFAADGRCFGTPGAVSDDLPAGTADFPRSSWSQLGSKTAPAEPEPSWDQEDLGKYATATLSRFLAICNQGLGRNRKSSTFGI